MKQRRERLTKRDSYQCAYNTFERSGYSREDARRIMLNSVKLAVEAKRRFLEEQKHQSTSAQRPRFVKIALSLGPYGATLSPAQEFDGFYPPPYGPDLSSTTVKTNTFADTEQGRALQRAATDALADFHYERLSVFVEDRETWDALDFVAFETVPLRSEIRAIRRAVARLQGARGLVPFDTPNTGDGKAMKPWWISTVHPDGQYPEMKASGGRASTTEVVEAALLSDDASSQEKPTPWGFGINCTSIESLPVLLDAVEAVAERASKANNVRKPWLVLYPNRGDVYDPATQTWRERSKLGSEWAKELQLVVLEAEKAQVWEGFVVGGCCKTGPDDIAKLRQELGTL